MVQLAQTTGLDYANNRFTASIQSIKAFLPTTTTLLYRKYTNICIMLMPTQPTENKRRLQ